MNDAYQKAYNRERAARFSAENLLEKKTKEVQTNIGMIQFQFNDLMLQKKESDYLLSVARLAQNQGDLVAVVERYLKASIVFIGAKIGRFSYIKDNNLTYSDIVGCNRDIPKFSIDIYKRIYDLGMREVIHVSELSKPSLELILIDLGVNRIVFVPIKCFGEITFVCEFYLPESIDFKSEILDQCEVASYQISSILEASINNKKLEDSYSEITNSHEKLKQAQSQLVQSEKMASLGQLAAGVAHEINNPIGFVMSNVSTLKEYLAIFSQHIALTNELIRVSKGPEVDAIRLLDEEQNLTFMISDINDIMEDCSDGLRRVKDIVSNLKSFARSDDEEASEFDLNECIINTIKVVWNELKYKVTLHKDFSLDLPRIPGHEGQVGQVIMNMLVNATHAIGEKGDIYISTSKVESGVQISIKDTGEGMSEDVLAKIFDPFFTTKGVSDGTGLGLSISYGIIESHAGNIKVSSKVGEGAEFIITLPDSS
ncbi:MAG: signal transduction histidine kinase [Bermanella sp.]|jgi:signal transduction histidine kinase